MTKLTGIRTWAAGHRWLLLGVWVALLLWAGFATWLKVAGQHREIVEPETRLADLDRWNVAGLWLSRSLAGRERDVARRWDELFPGERNREELFLALAGIADSSGVRDFELAERVVAEAEAVTADAADDDMMMDEPDQAPVESFRVAARFRGHYGQVARFLGGLNGIERAVSLHNLAIRPSLDVVEVELELDFYVSKRIDS